jgi:hypothetical protein
MRLKSVSRILATTAIVALTLPALAQDKSGPNAGTPAEGAAPGGAATMGLAQELYAVGVAQGDAVTVLAAAKMAASVSVEEKTPAVLELPEDVLAALASSKDTGPSSIPRPEVRQKVATVLAGDAIVSLATVGTPAADDAEGAADAPVTADAMFAKAKELAGGDDALLGVIDDAMAETGRGRIGGAVQWLSRLPAGSTDVWEVPFYGNSYAELAVVGDGDANLDVLVTDENGNVFCYDVSWSDSLYCDFTPAWDGYFYVTVENLGRSRNSYYLMTN